MSVVPAAVGADASTSDRLLGVAILGAGQVAARHADAMREVSGACLGFGAQLANVANTIRTGAAPGVPGEWGRLVVRVLLAAEESASQRHEIRLN